MSPGVTIPRMADVADVERLTAHNPGPMTLEGTNTYVVGRDPAMVIDPGPDDAGHIGAIREAAEARGGIGTVLLTHAHGDHSGAVSGLGLGRRGVPGRWASMEFLPVLDM